MRYVLPAAAQDDIRDLLGWTHERFGAAARVRYQALLATALRDLAHQPARPGSVERPELGQGVRSWHLQLSRERARNDPGVVRRPRHFVIYRVEAERILIGRVLHDAMELARHLDADAPWK